MGCRATTQHTRTHTHTHTHTHTRAAVYTPILLSYHLATLPSYHLYYLTTLQVFYAITFSKELNSIGGNLYAGVPTRTFTRTRTLTRTRTQAPALSFSLSPARSSAPGALFGALIELPAYLALAPATNRLGRRAAYAGFLLLAAAACVILQLELGAELGAARPGSAPAAAGANATRAAAAAAELGGALGGAARWRATGAVLCGRFASVAAVNVGYIVSAELFPTSCRNSGIGWSTGCGRIGAMLAPHLMLGLAKPLLLFALLCVAAAATMGLLPESAGAAMADVPEAERVGTGTRQPASPGLTPAASPREVPLVSASAGGATDTAGGGVAPAGQRWRDGV